MMDQDIMQISNLVVSIIIFTNNSIIGFMYMFAKLIPVHSGFGKPTNTTSVTSENNIDTYFLVSKDVRSLMFLFTLYFPFENVWMSCVIVIYLYNFNRTSIFFQRELFLQE